jgi:AcrR family transcriptional regulator
MAKGAASKLEPSARERILEAAYAVAEQSGIAAVTLDAVAAEAGVSKGGLLYHFPSKDALVSAMVDGLSRMCRDLSAAAAQADPEPVGRSARAYLAACTGDLWHSSRWTALVGALVFNPELLDAWRADMLAGRTADEHEGVDPVAAEIVRLAADGMWVWAMLGLPGPDPELKAKVLAKLNQLTRNDRVPSP